MQLRIVALDSFVALLALTAAVAPGRSSILSLILAGFPFAIVRLLMPFAARMPLDPLVRAPLACRPGQACETL